jgi:hypothetical protein
MSSWPLVTRSYCTCEHGRAAALRDSIEEIEKQLDGA